jgi:cytochrome c-type biogenesis protein CcmE
MKRSWKLTALIVAAAAVIVWAVLFVTVGGDFYKTVDEVERDGSVGTPLRVGGTVAPESIVQAGDAVRFELEGSAGEKLGVVYAGAYPDRLGPYAEVVVSGALDRAGEFQATQVLVKCPDKLLPEKATGGLLETLGLRRLLY